MLQAAKDDHPSEKIKIALGGYNYNISEANVMFMSLESQGKKPEEITQRKLLHVKIDENADELVIKTHIVFTNPFPDSP